MSFVADDKVAASEIRQWLYCPRVVWYGRQFGNNRPTSAMMQIGIDEEAERRRLEARRTFSGYGIGAVARYNQVHVWSERLCISGMVDTLLQLTEISLESASEVHPTGDQQLFVPVEFKTTMRRDQRENTLQLATYALCIEEMTGSPVRYGFLVMLPSEEVIRQTFGTHIRATVRNVTEQVLAAVEEGELPQATTSRGKCRNCEFRRFCNDIW